MSQRDAIVPLQVDAASGPEEVISERALETGSRSLGANAWRDLRRRPMFWISLALIVLFLVMAIFPQLFTSKDPNFADLTKARQSPSDGGLVRLRRAGLRPIYPNRLWRPSFGQRGHSCHGVHPDLRVCGRDHCRLPRRLARLGDRANCRDFLGDSDIPRWNPVPLHVPQ